jgi:hypothetical protein
MVNTLQSKHAPSLCDALVCAGGLMLCVDMRFSDWFGLTAADCLGKPFTSLSVEPEALTG